MEDMEESLAPYAVRFRLSPFSRNYTLTRMSPEVRQLPLAQGTGSPSLTPPETPI